jgi:hypothetical protein
MLQRENSSFIARHWGQRGFWLGPFCTDSAFFSNPFQHVELLLHFAFAHLQCLGIEASLLKLLQ